MDSDSRAMLLETADRFFTERVGKAVVNDVEKGVWPNDLWKEIEEMGLPLIAVPEDKNGVGGTLADMLALLRLAGSHAVPVPLAETALGNLLIAAAGAWWPVDARQCGPSCTWPRSQPAAAIPPLPSCTSA